MDRDRGKSKATPRLPGVTVRVQPAPKESVACSNENLHFRQNTSLVYMGNYEWRYTHIACVPFQSSEQAVRAWRSTVAAVILF